MYVVNGIAYADDPQPQIKVLKVRPLDEYKLLVEFFDGIIKKFDLEPLLEMPCYVPLRDKATFIGVYVDGGTVVWNDGEIDIASETLFENGVPYIKDDNCLTAR